MIKLIRKYSERVLAKKAAAIKRNVKLCPPDQPGKICILWHERDNKAFNFLYDHFRSKPVIIRHLCYAETEKPGETNCLTPKGLNWLGFPKRGMTDIFIETEFDLLFNITTEQCYPLEVISALSAASFKTGYDVNHKGFYDLDIDVSSQPDSLFLAEQQLLYLSKLTEKDEI
jgi:hypothetical protein